MLDETYYSTEENTNLSSKKGNNILKIVVIISVTIFVVIPLLIGLAIGIYGIFINPDAGKPQVVGTYKASEYSSYCQEKFEDKRITVTGLPTNITKEKCTSDTCTLSISDRENAKADPLLNIQPNKKGSNNSFTINDDSTYKFLDKNGQVVSSKAVSITGIVDSYTSSEKVFCTLKDIDSIESAPDYQPEQPTLSTIENLCVEENNKKNIRLDTFVDLPNNIYTFNSSKSIRLKASGDLKKKFASIDLIFFLNQFPVEKPNKNTLENLPTLYSDDDLILYSTTGELIRYGEKVQLTGVANIEKKGNDLSCSLTVETIEKSKQ